jgi:hypothetical protein
MNAVKKKVLRDSKRVFLLGSELAASSYQSYTWVYGIVLFTDEEHGSSSQGRNVQEEELLYGSP